MKIAVLTLATLLLLSGCKGKEESKKSAITAKEVCALMDSKSVESIVGKKLTAKPSKRQFDYARTCTYSSKSGYPYIVLTLYFNDRGKDVAYFAPPSDVFNSEIKKLPNEVIAVLSKKSKETIELLAKSAKRVVAFTLMKVDAKDGSKNQNLLIQKLQEVANKAKKL